MALTGANFLGQAQQRKASGGASSFLDYTPSIKKEPVDTDYNKGGLLGGVGYTLGKFGTGAFSVLEGIWDFTAGGIADFFGADEWAEEQFANNIAAGWNQDLDEWYNPSKGMQMVGDVASGISNTLVGIAGAAAITYFTGGAAAPYAGTIAAGIMGVGAAGNATSEAYAKTGELGFKEYAYGALSGGTEMALEKFTGVTGKYATKLLGKETAKTVAKKSLLKGMWSDFKSEFVEEAISEFITPYYQRWTQVDPNAENATIQQIGYAGLVGGLSGALMGGIGTGISSAKALNRGNEISKNQDYTNAVVGMAEKFAQYETDNNTGKEAYQYISQLVADFKARDNGTGTLTAMQKKLLGEMEHASVVLTYEPEIQRSKEKIIANADDFAQYINSRNIIDGATGKPFRFANGAELAQNDALVTQFAVADALGQLMLAPDSVYDLVSSKRTDGIMQADFRNFQKGGRAEHKQAVNELFGIDVDGMTYEDFIETIKKTDKAKFDSIQGGMSARAASKKAISYAKNTGAEINAFDKGANIVEGTTVYTSKKGVGGKIIAITKTGNGYYLYNGNDISKKLTKAQLLEVIDALNGVAPATNQATETTAKKGQKTAKKPTTQTSPTGTQTAQETEKSKPKTAPKKKATVKKKTAAVKPATEKAKPTDKATQKREAIAKMRKSEDTTERVLAELYDNGAADHDAVSAMKDGQDLSTVDKVAFFATGTVKDYARQGLYTEKSLAKAIKEYADDIRAGKDVLVQVMDRAIELDGKQQPNWYKEQYHKAAESTQATETVAPKKPTARRALVRLVMNKDTKEFLRGAAVKDGKQYISDGFFVARFTDVLGGVTDITSKDYPFEVFDGVISENANATVEERVEIDADKIRGYVPTKRADYQQTVMRIGKNYYQLPYVSKIIDSITNPQVFLKKKGDFNPIYVKGDNGEAVFLPLRPQNGIVKPIYEADYANYSDADKTKAQKEREQKALERQKRLEKEKAEREAEDKKRAEEYEKSRKEEKQRNIDKIIAAEKDILDGKMVKSENVQVYKNENDFTGKETSTFIALLDKYGISVPIKTRGWIIENMKTAKRLGGEGATWHIQFKKGATASKSVTSIMEKLYQAIAGTQQTTEITPSQAETTTAKPVKEKTIHGKSYKDFTVEEFNALSAPFRGYYLAKSKKPNAIVFAQLGDFYEAFFDDAKTLANEFELTLTGRAVNGYTDRVEMVGFPVRFFDDYKAKLNAKGLDVVKVDLDGKKVLYTAKTGTESTTQYAISESATQETQLAGGKSQNLTPLQMKRAESFARTHVKGYENLTAAEKLEVEWTIASGWRYGASESDILSLAKISAQSGVGIGFADLKATTSDGKVVAPDAVCYTNSNHLTIYLNPKSKRTVEVATLHELTHALKGAKGYAELEKMALEYYAKHPEEKAAIDNAYRALYQDEQLRYEKEVLPDELTAHYIEKMLEKRNVLAQMTAEQPTFMQRCINWLKTRVDKLRGVDTQAADEVDILARKFVSTFNLNKGTVNNDNNSKKFALHFGGVEISSKGTYKIDTESERVLADIEAQNDITNFLPKGLSEQFIKAIKKSGNFAYPRLYRGMEAAELDSIIENGYIKSNSSYNFSNQQGQTLFAHNIRNAFSYATGFAPSGIREKFFEQGLPAYIIEVGNYGDLNFKYNSAQESYTYKEIDKKYITRILELSYNQDEKKVYARDISINGMNQAQNEAVHGAAHFWKDKTTGTLLFEVEDSEGYASGFYISEYAPDLYIDYEKLDGAPAYEFDFRTSRAKISGNPNDLVKIDFPKSQTTVRYALSSTHADGVDLIDNYTEKQYNDFGWARVNGVLSYRENGNFRTKYGEIKSGKQSGVHKTSKGEIIVAVNDMEKGKFGINNVLVFAKGSYENYKITRVIRLKSNSETHLDIVRGFIYEYENDTNAQTRYTLEELYGEELIEQYDSRDFDDYRTSKARARTRGRGTQSVGSKQDSGIGAIGKGNTDSDSNNGVKRRYALKGSDKVMTELPDERVTVKDVLLGRATKAELATQVKGGMSEQSEAVKVLMTNAQAALERVLTENGVADATARTNYIRAGKYAAHNAIETQGGQYSLDGETRVGDSLGKIMQPIYKANEKDGKTYADFELYLLHHHNIDRMAVGKPVFGDDVTAADSQTAIAELDKEYPQFRKIAEKIWKFNDNNLQLSVDSGMYSQEYADTLREMYPHYVPTFREEYATRAAALMGKNNVWVNNAKKAAKGSSARILPIDDMMAAQTIQKTTSARINSLLVEMLERGDHDEFKVIATEDAEIQIDDDTQVTTHEDKTKNTHQVTFYHNGKKVTAQVSRLVFKGIEAFRASSDMSDNVALNAVAKVNSTFKKLVTSLNPFFSFFKNPIRDMQDALLYTRYSHREYLKNYNRARQEIAHNGHYWQEAKAAGITAASVYDYQKGIEYKQNGAGAKVKRFWGKLESASNAIEMAPRMAEYISAREAGLSVQEALLQAQDVTTNFGRGGTFAKKLNSTVMPFLNPAIQGFSKMWRSYTGENGKKAWVNLIIRSLILGIGATALNDLLNGDDEEYENLSDYVKEQNYVIALGGGDFLKIPKGRVIGVFGNAFLRGKRYAQGETDAWEGYFDSVMSSVTPVENFTRTIFSPITDAQTNTTWYGGAIESQKWNDTEPKNRYDESTSKIAIWLGSVFNYSPLKIDYLLEQYTGIVGDLVLPATSTQAESGIITQNMLVNSTTNSKWSTKFYSTLEDYTYKKTAGDLQAKGAVRYLNSINSTVSDMYNQKRTIQADKTLSNDEKLTQTKIIQAAINTLMQEAIGNAEYIYGEMGKYNLADDDVFDQAYLDSISVVMGEEYALKSYNKDVYEKATKINKLGIDYATYYDFYFGIKNITSDKKADGSTVAGSKKAKVINYVMSQNLSTAQKLVLIMAQGYTITDNDVKGLTAKQAKTTVAKYITSLNLTREEKTELAEMLGFTVKNGKIYFN